MYQPRFTINNSILTNISQVEAARAIINAAPLVPAYEKQFRAEAIAKVVHYATKLEGNDLSFEQVAKVIEGKELSGFDRDVQEVLNYRRVIKYLDELLALHQEKLPLPGEKVSPDEKMQAGDVSFSYSELMLKRIYQLVVEKIIPETQGQDYRRAQVVLENTRTGQVVFRPPPFMEVPYLIKSFLSWLNSEKIKELHPVIQAGITHYILVAIHPFIEGNGRTARAFSSLVLMVESYDIRGLFALEEYFDRNASDYYHSLQSVSSQPAPLAEQDLTSWLEFFTQALALELQKIKGKVERLSSDLRLKQKLGGKQLPLTERQIKLIEYMRQFGGLRIADARELFPMISQDTVWRDLKKLIEEKIVLKKGSTKGAYYTLV
ncbi:Fic family protein [Candidatus Shapirobacteria bacterium]|nr:Fic family protein [Candidatus Shapirobacteria bacterium]